MIKKYILSFLIFLFTCISFGYHAQVKQGLIIPKNPKIGLSLAGGGAKGFAHVGVLKMLDSLGVKVDYISGTSMGSIVGGMYAAGYSGKEIEAIIRETDFISLITAPTARTEKSFVDKSNDKYLFSVPVKDGKLNFLPKAISNGQRNIYLLKEIFRNVKDIEDFSKLPIPFMCIATNLETGKIKEFERGDIVQSIMASSAFPGLLDPVKINDSLYIDGAMTVNYPSRQLKEKGMDIVIGVDLNQGLQTREQLVSAAAIINQVIDFGIQRDTQLQYEYTDINIKPDLTGLGATSYDDKDKILRQGDIAAQKYLPWLQKLPQSPTRQVRARTNFLFSTSYNITTLKVTNNKIFNKDYIIGKMNLRLPQLLSYTQINSMLDKLYATGNYNLISYDIEENEGNYSLNLNVEEDTTRLFLKAGLHYDPTFRTGLLLNATFRRPIFNNSIASLDVVIGDKPRYYFNYFIDNGYIPGFGLYASGMTFNTKNQNGDDIESWSWIRNEAYIQSIWKDKYALGGGISHDYFKVKSIPTTEESHTYSINPYIFLKSDTRDDRSFPTRGIYLHSELKFLDIFGKIKTNRQIQSRTDLRINIPINTRLTNRIRGYSAFSIGEEISPFYNFRAGGIFDQNIHTFFQMPGYQFGQIQAKNLIILGDDLQVNVIKNVYATAHFYAAGAYDTFDLKQIFNFKYSSVGITLGYKTPAGQVKLNISKSIDKTPGIFSVVLGHWF